MSLKKKLNNRENFGIFTACVGIFTNLFLSAGKIFVGIFSGARRAIDDIDVVTAPEFKAAVFLVMTAAADNFDIRRI